MEELKVNFEAEIKQKIQRLGENNPNGFNETKLFQTFPNLAPTKITSVLNDLLQNNVIQVFRVRDQLVYRLKPKESSETSDLSEEDKIVYQIIQDSGNKGVWQRSIQNQSKIFQIKLTSILKSLKKKRLIKDVKAVNNSKKKLYMLFDVTPDESVTGGTWYEKQTFEADFVEILNQQVAKFLQSKVLEAEKATDTSPLEKRKNSFVTSENVLNFIMKSGICKIELQLRHIENILDTLDYEGKLEVSVQPNSNGENIKVYRYTNSLVENSEITRSPCGICPLVDRCEPGGYISPTNCDYINQWLDF